MTQPRTASRLTHGQQADFSSNEASDSAILQSPPKVMYSEYACIIFSSVDYQRYVGDAGSLAPHLFRSSHEKEMKDALGTA